MYNGLVILFNLLSFLVGFLLGASLIYLWYQPVQIMVSQLEKRYENLINILSQWQKKI